MDDAEIYVEQLNVERRLLPFLTAGAEGFRAGVGYYIVVIRKQDVPIGRTIC